MGNAVFKLLGIPNPKLFDYKYNENLKQKGYYLTVYGSWEYACYFATILKISETDFIQMIKNYNAKEYGKGILYFENEADAKDAVDNIIVIARLNNVDMNGFYSFNLGIRQIISSWYITYLGQELDPKYMCNNLKMSLLDYKMIMLSCNANYSAGSVFDDSRCSFKCEEDVKMAVAKLRQYLSTREV